MEMSNVECRVANEEVKGKAKASRYFGLIQPNPTQANLIQPNPTESDQIKP